MIFLFISSCRGFLWDFPFGFFSSVFRFSLLQLQKVLSLGTLRKDPKFCLLFPCSSCVFNLELKPSSEQPRKKGDTCIFSKGFNQEGICSELFMLVYHFQTPKTYSTLPKLQKYKNHYDSHTKTTAAFLHFTILPCASGKSQNRHPHNRLTSVDVNNFQQIEVLLLVSACNSDHWAEINKQERGLISSGESN